MHQLGNWSTKEYGTDPTDELISILNRDYHPNQQTLEVWGQRAGSLWMNGTHSSADDDDHQD